MVLGSREAGKQGSRESKQGINDFLNPTHQKPKKDTTDESQEDETAVWY
jgi:hypothetical protein